MSFLPRRRFIGSNLTCFTEACKFDNIYRHFALGGEKNAQEPLLRLPSTLPTGSAPDERRDLQTRPAAQTELKLCFTSVWGRLTQYSAYQLHRFLHIDPPVADVNEFTAIVNWIRPRLKDWRMLIDLPFLLFDGHLSSTAALFICCSHNVYAHRLKKKKEKAKRLSVKLSRVKSTALPW